MDEEERLKRYSKAYNLYQQEDEGMNKKIICKSV